MSNIRKNETNKKVKLVSFRCTEKEYEQIKKESVKKKSTISDLLLNNGIAGTERRKSKDKKRTTQMVKNEESLKLLRKKIEESGSGNEAVIYALQELEKGIEKLWEC